MPLVFASICPHPPILIPEIGGNEINKVTKTKNAMEKLAKILAEKEPETLIIISPHGLVHPDRMNVCGMKKIYGDLSNFNAPKVRFNFDNDLELAYEIDRKANQMQLQTLLYNNGGDYYELDHGSIVPLYFLTQKLERPVKLVPISYSFQDRQTHFQFGQIIYEIISKKSESIGIIASGDLSHRLIPASPAGYNEYGKEFDKRLVEVLKKKDINQILEFDEDFVEEAGECGYRSILILLGAINKLKWKPEVLSYEGPFGVGYMVANLEIKEVK